MAVDVVASSSNDVSDSVGSYGMDGRAKKP